MAENSRDIEPADCGLLEPEPGLEPSVIRLPSIEVLHRVLEPPRSSLAAQIPLAEVASAFMWPFQVLSESVAELLMQILH